MRVSQLIHLFLQSHSHLRCRLLLFGFLLVGDRLHLLSRLQLCALFTQSVHILLQGSFPRVSLLHRFRQRLHTSLVLRDQQSALSQVLFIFRDLFKNEFAWNKAGLINWRKRLIQSVITHFLVTVYLEAFQSLTSLHQILHFRFHLADKQSRYRELLFEFTVAFRWSNLEFEITINKIVK